MQTFFLLNFFYSLSFSFLIFIVHVYIVILSYLKVDSSFCSTLISIHRHHLIHVSAAF